MPDVNQLIQDFYRVATNREFSRDFLFRLISISPGAASAVTFDENDLVYIRAAQLPDRAITNVAVPYMGLPFNVPGNATYPNSAGYNLRFYCDAKSAVRQKFEQWSRDTFDDATSTGNYFTPKQTSTIDMVQLDPQLNKLTQYQLVGVSVRNLGPIEYNISDGTGQTVDFTAVVAYHYWRRVS